VAPRCTLPEVPIARLRELFDYNPDTGALRWRISPSMRTKAGDPCGFLNRNEKGRPIGIRISINGHQHYAHRLIWALHHGFWPERFLMIDHKNGDPADNRIANLRIATGSQNAGNSARQSNSGTGFKGVTRNGRGWQASLTTATKDYYLGTFDTPQEAHAAYWGAAQVYFGDFACNGERQQ
jgi:hypothetical protein